MRILPALFLSAFTLTAFAQNPKKTLVAIKTETAPKIDGILDDAVWNNVPIATDFVELQPNAGQHEKQDERTEVKILYDNSAIYIGARMYETSADKVARELATRDKIGNADFIGIILDTYKDGINGSGFFVTAANSQFDAKYAPNPNGNIEDETWNAVWISRVNVDSLGWTAELKIPYSALRFAKKDVQTWGMNLIRKRQFEQKQLFWNELDPKQSGLINQEGILTGLEKLTPPVRLAFYPYFSTYVNNYPYNTPGVKNTTTSVNGGMDVKYGINESFTLDLTLIPDFGQVQSDNKILNLTPFEVKYNENRPFFTEGTELFNKGNLFYSRRVGGQPINFNNAYNDLKPGEEVVKNPTETKLLNATKLSGRLSNGLGIGVFNAITNTSYATIEDAQGNRREVQTSPLTNYNIIVLDQNLKNNSAVTLINTNVDRFGKDYSADVGGLVYNLNNKKNNYNLSGYGFMSNLFYPDKPTQTGYSYEIGGGKSSGNFTWNVYEDFVSSTYDQNDLGILFNNNFIDHNINLQYTNYKPKKFFTQWGAWTNTYYSRRVTPSAYQYFNQNFGAFFNFKNFWYGNFNGHFQQEGNDFYEPRTESRVYKSPQTFILNFNLGTNQAKRLSGGLFYSNKWLNRLNGKGTDIEVYYNLRLSNRFSFGGDVTYSPRINYTGYSTRDTLTSDPIFALRNVHTVENIFNLKYTFNSVMGLSLRLRHYWSKLNNKEFFDLAQDGSLAPLSTNNFNHEVDQNFNTWNIDMIYVWQFSPGSELSISWKNSTQTFSNLANQGYFRNFDNTFNQPQNNNFSLKLLYYIDFQDLRKRHKSK
ncbi:DUF5916 domain-containing protein [Mucilaginibacter segetis]|uniref:Carbohydrate binding protein with CBM9 domain n=1 Tax=Mucilaginibacter segetis TaxID=2793071 RepID=A0A934UND8_9SPHI|nr:DUF5916 domain-containing protein [Mucilaginibacter segetis]MBK0379975.1 hypothetical protein [Mucilaginibacter segetis]